MPQLPKDKTKYYNQKIGFNEPDDPDADVDTHSPPVSQNLLDEEDLDREQRVPTKELEPIPFFRNPLLRLLAVLGATIFVVLAISAIIGSLSNVKYGTSYMEYRQRKKAGENKPAIASNTDSTTEALKAEIALMEQKRELEDAERKRREEEAEPEMVVPRQSPPLTKIEPPVQPASVPRQEISAPSSPVPRPAPQSQAAIPAQKESKEASISPEQQYQMATNLGVYQGAQPQEATSSEVEAAEDVPNRQQVAHNPVIPSSIPPSRVVSIGSRVRAKLLSDFVLEPGAVALVELREALLYSDGSVALPVSTRLTLIYDDANISHSSILLKSAIVTRNGVEIELALPQKSLAIRGKNGGQLAFESRSQRQSAGVDLGDVVEIAKDALALPRSVTRTARAAVGSSANNSSRRSHRGAFSISGGTDVEVYALQSFMFKQHEEE